MSGVTRVHSGGECRKMRREKDMPMKFGCESPSTTVTAAATITDEATSLLALLAAKNAQ